MSEIIPIDEAEFSGENAEVYLFTWLTTTEKKLSAISPAALKPHQAMLEKSLLGIITMSQTTYPPPGRAFRNLVARCLVLLYATGETRTMFDTLQACMKVVSTLEKDKSEAGKIAAYWCIGELMGVYGSQVMSFMAEIAAVTIKTYRSSSSPLLRFHALVALEKSLKTAKRAVAEQTLKDINKQMKNGLVDKAWAVQRGATRVLIALHSGSDAIALTTSEIEGVIAQCVRSLDGADRVTRQAHAHLVGHLLSLSQIEGRKDLGTAAAAASVDTKGKNAKQDADKDDLNTGDVSGAPGTAEQKSKPLLTPQEMLGYLSKEVNKPHATRKTRTGMFDFYEAVLMTLGDAWVEANFGVLVGHLVNEVVGHPRFLALAGASGGNAAAGAAVGGGGAGNPARYEGLLIRDLISLLLRDLVAVRMLSEQGQIGAIGEWATGYLKRWPAMMPGQGEPKEAALVLALREVGGLVVLLGNAPGVVQNALSDPLVTLLSHPSHSVRVNASWALRCFCASTPLKLAKTILVLVDKLTAQISGLLTPTASPETPQRALGHAYALAALVSLIPHRPWYVSYDVPGKVMDMAVGLLKKAGEHAVNVASVEIEVAWRLMSGCMGLGRGFVRGYLAQVLVLWRNALPKVTSKDNATAGRSGQEWAFLMQVRECALGAIWCFLRSHATPPSLSTAQGGGLVTLDVARRIAACLSNALAFANSYISVASSVEDPFFSSRDGASATPSGNTARGGTGLSLRDREALLRRRIFECFALISVSAASPPAPLTSSASFASFSQSNSHAGNAPSAISELTQDALLRSAISLFASPDGYAGNAVQAAIASSTGSFGGVWATAGVGDGYAYGVGWRVVKEVLGDGDVLEGADWDVDALMRRPILGSCEHDPISVCLPTPDSSFPSSVGFAASSSGSPSSASTSCSSPSSPYYLYEPPPPSTAVVDASIELFARLLPLQDLATTVKTLQLLIDEVRANKVEKNAGRRGAVWVNACVALVLVLRGVMGGKGKEVWGSERVTGALAGFLMEALTEGDPVLRASASECIGRLASLSGTSYLTSQIKDLVDMVVNNRTPASRAGCAWAFGAVHFYVGGLAAGPLLKTTVNVLMSLVNDPHPTVHYHALRALGKVVGAASLGYAPYVSATLGMLLKVYLLETHERECGKNVDVSEGWGVCVVDRMACRVIDAVIGVLGPDIQESTRTRGVILGLVNEFWVEGERGGGSRSTQVDSSALGDGDATTVVVGVEAIKCIQHFLIFTPEHADVPSLVKRFLSHLSSSSPLLRPLKVASINALYQLVQKDAVVMSTLGGDRLVEDLFGLLDDGNDSGGVGDSGGDVSSIGGGVRSVIESWLAQTGVLNPRAWIGLCQRIMRRTTAGQGSGTSSKGEVGRDDEGESLSGAAGGAGNGGGTGRTHQTSRWRTQLFALQCLHSICTLVVASGRKEHLSAIVARAQGVSLEGMFFNSVGDLIKMAFTASTSYVMEIRLAGLVVLRDVIETFAKSPDPAYDDALLLEQHQAPITAALTPAFSSDSTPEILASAVHACAIFVGCGVVKDVGRMGRILKLLITALEQSKDTGMLSLGEAGELSSNASAMLRISTLSAWAQLQVASPQQTYLDAVLKPYKATLASLWIASLRDYASIRVDSEGLSVGGAGDMGGGPGSVIDSGYGTLGKEVLLPYYAKAWSIILEAVATAMQSDDPYILAAMDGQDPATSPATTRTTSDRTEPTAFFFIIFGIVYEALAASSTDNSSVQTRAERQATLTASLHALKSLVRPQYAGKAILGEPTIFEEFVSLCYRLGMTEGPSVQVLLVEVLREWAAGVSGKRGGDILSMTEPSSHCLRICAHVIKQTTGSTRGVGGGGIQQVSDKIAVITASLGAYASVAASIPTSSQREDVRAVAIFLYTDLLKDEASDLDFVSPTLPALKVLLDVPLVPTGEDEGKERYSRLVHALLSACLLNVDSMRGRSGAISAKKIKNNLLAAVLVLTVVPQWAKVGRAVIEHCCFLISQKLMDMDEVTLTASHCAKTLILASAAGSPTLRQCTRLLIPGLIEFVANVVPLFHEGSISDQYGAAIGEVWRAFSGLFSATPEELRPRLLGVLLPTISLFLPPTAPSQPAAASVATQTVNQLLAFATSSPAAFKEAAGKLDAPVREALEQAIRKAVGGGVAGGVQPAAKPQISLRSF